ncbi:MAG: gliding motility protein GldL, partial [Bacteroidaceae bacterium]|nr:gliding motility protein GldL [Bacteroidaceae bacterium]
MANKYNPINVIQKWMDTMAGQTFMNYAYSWGAAVVILGTLFKLTHIPGANLMLFIGMGTEVVVFFLSAFDRPFDKEEIGKVLPKTLPTDEEIIASMEDSEAPTASATMAKPASPAPVAAASSNAVPSTPAAPSTAAPVLTLPQDADAEQLAAIIRAANDELLHRAQAVLSPEMEEATKVYIDKLRTLTETFAKVDEQSARLTRDSEEMDNLNRTLTGINKVYELHLKSISLQVGTIDDINNQTQKLAEQIQSLNQVYGRMIEALTVNMGRTAAPAA